MILKFMAIGFLVGIVVGYILLIVDATLLSDIFNFKQTSSYDVRWGSIFNVSPLVPIYIGIFGGVVGLIVGKIRQLLKPPKTNQNS